MCGCVCVGVVGGVSGTLSPAHSSGRRNEKEKQACVLLPESGVGCKTHGPNFTAVDGEVRADVGAGTSMQSADINTSVIVTFA